MLNPEILNFILLLKASYQVREFNFPYILKQPI